MARCACNTPPRLCPPFLPPFPPPSLSGTDRCRRRAGEPRPAPGRAQAPAAPPPPPAPFPTLPLAPPLLGALPLRVCLPDARARGVEDVLWVRGGAAGQVPPLPAALSADGCGGCGGGLAGRWGGALGVGRSGGAAATASHGPLWAHWGGWREGGVGGDGRAGRSGGRRRRWRRWQQQRQQQRHPSVGSCRLLAWSGRWGAVRAEGAHLGWPPAGEGGRGGPASESLIQASTTHSASPPLPALLVRVEGGARPNGGWGGDAGASLLRPRPPPPPGRP